MATARATLALLLTLGAMAHLQAQAGPAAGVPAGSHVGRSGGSQVPCAAPLAWRVVRVDDEFGVSATEATEIVRQAAELWQPRDRPPLFVHDAANGFPIRLVHDDRQERTEERRRREAQLAEDARRLDLGRAELLARVEAHASARAAYTERVQALDRRVEEHNASVRLWNDRGGAPEHVARALTETGRAVDAERVELQAARRGLEAEQRSLQGDERGLNRQVADHRARAQALARDFPPESLEAGEYREALRVEGARVVSVSREIRIYQFASSGELRLVAAHELGHALGLGHSAAPGAVMNAEHAARLGATAPGGSGAGGSLPRADLEALGAACPGLVAARP